MVCIYCDSDTKVTNSRLQRRHNSVWRRRECQGCHNTTTTIEKTELGASLMVKVRSGKLEPFSRDKLFISIYESCKHRTNPISDASALTQTIISDALSRQADGVIDREEIVLTAVSVLQRFDPSAATIYQAYHSASN